VELLLEGILDEIIDGIVPQELLDRLVVAQARTKNSSEYADFM
jgi:hypothetical protein